jgi:hypothetical protein
MMWKQRRLRTRFARRMYRAKRWVNKWLYQYYLTRRRPLPDYLRNSFFLEINSVAEDRYQHRPYPGSMVVFRDQGPYPDPYLGWQRFVEGSIEAFEVPVSVAHHRAIMQEPAVAILAERMQEYIRRKSAAAPAVDSSAEPHMVSLR